MPEASNVFVVNAGSSSLKYKLFRFPGAVEILAGSVEAIGEPSSRFTHTDHAAGASAAEDASVADHAAALSLVRAKLEASGVQVDACGHRVRGSGKPRGRFSFQVLSTSGSHPTSDVKK